MKIDLVKIKLSQSDKYKYKPFKWCCEEMKNNPVTLFTDEDLVAVNGFDYPNHPHMCLNYVEIIQDYDDEYEYIQNYPIQYCPWCGEKIEVDVVNELDMTIKEREVMNKLEKLHEKINKSDSIKERTRLSGEEELLRNEVDKMYYLNEYKEENI